MTMMDSLQSFEQRLIELENLVPVLDYLQDQINYLFASQQQYAHGGDETTHLEYPENEADHEPEEITLGGENLKGDNGGYIETTATPSTTSQNERTSTKATTSTTSTAITTEPASETVTFIIDSPPPTAKPVVTKLVCHYVIEKSSTPVPTSEKGDDQWSIHSIPTTVQQPPTAKTTSTTTPPTYAEASMVPTTESSEETTAKETTTQEQKLTMTGTGEPSAVSSVASHGSNTKGEEVVLMLSTTLPPDATAANIPETVRTKATGAV
ncbi:uncharacterized protein [Diadema setosum]|uniref:uncharacterized protein n=1 Tax=Diadema setosum TaxID=31175 RepID=UPI003B3B7C6B